MEELLGMVLEGLRERGWDVAAVGASEDYNQQVEADGKQAQLAALPEGCVVVCAGHSKAKWSEAKKLLEEGVDNPFDFMSERDASLMKELCHEYDGNVNCQVFFTHSQDPFLLSFQRLAVAIGLGIYHHESHMILHKLFGPWIALRFALVIRLPESCLPSANLHDFIDIMKRQHSDYLDSGSNFVLERAESECVSQILSEASSYDASIYLKARKSFTVGKEFMYDNDQMAYHYQSILPDLL